MKLRFPFLIIALLIILSNDSMANDKQPRFNKLDWGADDGAAAVSYAPYNYAPQSPVFTLRLDPGYTTDSYELGPEILTTTSGFYDYKTNGESNHYIQVDPSDPLLLHAVDVIADSLDPTGVTSRRTQYAVSSDGGLTWFPIDQVPGIRSGYPVIKLKDGLAVISNHALSNGLVNTGLYIDVAPQAGGFTPYEATLPFSIWPQVSVYNSNKIGILSRPQHPAGSDYDTIFYQDWTGTQLNPKSIAYVSSPPYIGTVGTNARYNMSHNGQSTVVQVFNGTLEDDTLGNSKIWMRSSTDNGTTWSGLSEIFTPFMENGDDTVGVAGGTDLVSNQIQAHGSSQSHVRRIILSLTQGST